VATERISKEQAGWLASEVAAWRAEGLVDEGTAAAIEGRYRVQEDRRGVPLLLFLGAALFGVGIIWLVAANVDFDEIGPLARIAGVAVVWLALVAVGEALDAHERWRPVAGPVRLLAALAFGGVVFQAAQSLQVPAFAPQLVFAWGIGALAYAYATGARGPLIIAIAALAGWYTWVLLDEGEGPSVILGFVIACPVAAAAGAASAGHFTGPWRFAAAAFGLLGLGCATVPDIADGDLPATLPLVLGALAGIAAVAIGMTRSPEDRRELLGAAGLAIAAALLVAVAPENAPDLGGGDRPSGAETAFTLLACGLFLAAAVGVALQGARTQQGSLSDLAYGALLVFLAVQSFGLLATLVSGAVLVLAVGAVLLVSGVLLDRGRRRLVNEAAG